MRFNIESALENMRKKKSQQYSDKANEGPQENFMASMPNFVQPGYVGQQPAQPSNITIPYRPAEAPVDIRPEQAAPVVQTIASQMAAPKSTNKQDAPKKKGSGALDMLTAVGSAADSEDAGSGVLQGLLAGAQTGNPWAAAGGAVVGGVMGGINAKEKRRAQEREAKAKALEQQSKIYESEAQAKSAALRNFMGSLGR